MTQTTPTPRDEAVLKDGWLKRDTAKAAARVAEWSINTEPAMNVHEYVDGYEFRGEQDYWPDEKERVLIEDAINGYLGLLASAPAPASGRVDAVEALEFARRVLSGRPDRSLADDLAIQRIDLVPGCLPLPGRDARV